MNDIFITNFTKAGWATENYNDIHIDDVNTWKLHDVPGMCKTNVW